MRAVILDTYYPQFLAGLQRTANYQDALKFTLGRFFGTHSAYSRHLNMYGWDAIDIIANDGYLQNLWAQQYGLPGSSLPAIALNQIEKFTPDVVFMQDLSFFDVATLDYLKKRYILAGQCSCRFDDDERLKRFNVIFTSLPTHMEKFERLGVKPVFLPLAFDPLVLETAYIPEQRTHISFVGGYGRHWNMDEYFIALAEKTTMEFWGYGFGTAPEPVRQRYRGQAWGLDMYEVYLGSHLVFNRHGGVSQGYANNLRMFEATGCGAMLLTEYAPNLTDYFADDECVTYGSVQEAVELVNYYQSHPTEMRAIAAKGQQRTVSEHTYYQRIKTVSEELKACVQSQQTT